MDFIKSVEEASKWSIEAWFALAVFCLIASIVYGVKYLARAQQSALDSWVRSQDSKEQILRQMITEAHSTNQQLVKVVTENNLFLSRNQEVLEETVEAVKLLTQHKTETRH